MKARAKYIFLILMGLPLGARPAATLPMAPSRLLELLLTRPENNKNTRVYYSHLVLLLKDQSNQALKQNSFKIRLPEGGGVIDFENHVKNNPRGVFNLQIKTPALLENQSSLRVYFLPRVKPISLESLTFGSSCKHFYNVSGVFKPEGHLMSKNGIELSSIDFRYLHTMGGDFYFAWDVGSDTFMSWVRFEDSRFKGEYCAR